MPPYNPAVDQPLVVFFDLQLGGLQKIYYYPEHPVSMDFSINSETEQNLHLSLFDQTALDVEPYIWAAMNNSNGSFTPQGTLTFGYQGKSQMKSQEYQFQVNQYEIVADANYISLNLDCTAYLNGLTSSNQYSGTVQQIIDQMCQKHHWAQNISPPFGDFSLQDGQVTDRDTTALSPGKHIKTALESDIGWLRRLTTFARDQQGNGGYRMYISGAGGQYTLNIVLAQNTSSDLSYDVQGPDSVVVTGGWRPGVCLAATAMNSSDSQEHGYQRGTGDDYKNRFDQNLTKKYQQTFGYALNTIFNRPVPITQGPILNISNFCSETMGQEITGSSARTRAGASATPYAGINRSMNSHLTNWMNNYEASLTVLGDPTLDPIANGVAQTVNVNYYLPTNYKTGNIGIADLHHSSGTYLFEGVRHVIHEGSFESTLTLRRAISEIPTVGGDD